MPCALHRHRCQRLRTTLESETFGPGDSSVARAKAAKQQRASVGAVEPDRRAWREQIADDFQPATCGIVAGDVAASGRDLGDVIEVLAADDQHTTVRLSLCGMQETH